MPTYPYVELVAQPADRRWTWRYVYMSPFWNTECYREFGSPPNATPEQAMAYFTEVLALEQEYERAVTRWQHESNRRKEHAEARYYKACAQREQQAQQGKTALGAALMQADDAAYARIFKPAS
jgi:hypothetical protein